MLFDSFPFIFGFLPLVLILYWALRRRRGFRASRLWLIGASLAFYFWGEKNHPLVVPALALFNFVAGTSFQHSFRDRTKKTVFILSLIVNLGVLAWYKYLVFFAGISNAWLGTAFA
ncbi:MAG: MBOAT family protein, partial [Elusimicrobia bacterium]|nr:MBOAT family protein [Elusimicrobiota bacterium]